MSLTKCNDCNTEISEKALWCTKCGRPRLSETFTPLLKDLWKAIIKRSKRMHIIWIFVFLSFIATIASMNNREFERNLTVSVPFHLMKIYTVITYAFVHTDISIWFYIMCFIILTGLIYEPKYGHNKTLLTMLLGIITTGVVFIIVSTIIRPPNEPEYNTSSFLCGIGAGFALYGAVVALWLLRLKHLHILEKILIILMGIRILRSFLINFDANNIILCYYISIFTGFLLVWCWSKKERMKSKDIAVEVQTS